MSTESTLPEPTGETSDSNEDPTPFPLGGDGLSMSVEDFRDACKLADSLETDDPLFNRSRPWDAIWLNPGGVDEAFVRKCFESGFLGVDEYTLGLSHRRSYPFSLIIIHPIRSKRRPDRPMV